MSKKKRTLENSDETEFEPAATPDDSTLHDSELQGEAVDPRPEEQTSVAMEHEESSEDLLDDVRRSLIEEEVDRDKKDSKWWRRIGRKDKHVDPDPPLSPVEIDLPANTLQMDELAPQPETTEPDEYSEQINDLIDLLETGPQDTEIAEVEGSSIPGADIPPDPEPEIDFEQLKEQAFRPRSTDEIESDVRSIALEDGEEVFVEVQAQAADPLEERLKGVENALKPYRTYLYITLAFLGVIMAVMAGFIILDAYRRAQPAPVKEVSNLPYPVAVSLPGGWTFNLGRGTLQDGQWEPNGAEWLEGTEVCRWVSLPWSLQLETVLRTLNTKDSIELVMSNNDKLVYTVYSMYEMTPEEIRKLDTNSPCLLLILTGADSDTRWVLTALP